ncbi:5-oxoprolinase subunit PxpB [Novosphingobium sp.]|uniref:5-oxoprolinase subunit PxpB n=1 Tax=Novosphingobium sp. TaxID=1874826 RepID=UPI002634BF16|nr:5-oxoprolinase subunit PxpB [Novosphingobium sp.]
MSAVSVRPIGESAVLIDFGGEISTATNERVVALDRALAGQPPQGMIETVPAYVSLMIVFDPLQTECDRIAAHALALLESAKIATRPPREHVIPVRYDAASAPDLETVAKATGLTPDEVVAQHLAGEYRVFMYGFAPGYAYLGGVPPALHLPRKPRAQRGHPAGSVIIAGAQCLITSLPMPTGWWVIGHTAQVILDPARAQPFLFDPGDVIRFERER